MKRGRFRPTFRIIISPNVSAKTRVFYTTSGTATSPFSILHSQVDYSGVTKTTLIDGSGGGGGLHFRISIRDMLIFLLVRVLRISTITPNDDSRPEGDETIIFSLAPDIAYDINPSLWQRDGSDS